MTNQINEALVLLDDRVPRWSNHAISNTSHLRGGAAHAAGGPDTREESSWTLGGWGDWSGGRGIQEPSGQFALQYPSDWSSITSGHMARI